MTDGQKIMVKFIVVLEAIQYYSPIILKRYVLQDPDYPWATKYMC